MSVCYEVRACVRAYASVRANEKEEEEHQRQEVEVEVEEEKEVAVVERGAVTEVVGTATTSERTRKQPEGMRNEGRWRRKRKRERHGREDFAEEAGSQHL